MVQENTFFLVDDPLFAAHRAPGSHPERPERLVAARAALAALPPSIAPVRLVPRDATDDDLVRVHDASYVAALESLRGRSGYIDADTYFTSQSVAAARRAAGGTIDVAESLVRGSSGLGVALVRPPGHHATPSGAMGFCLLNNVALAAAAARAAGAQRVAIVDWDVHHGNGTQDAFYEDPAVLYVSLHQYPFYPGTGSAGEVGAGEGRGTTVNVPLSAGAADAVYEAAFERIICPILEQYGPDLLLISAGFDAHARDPLAEMNLSRDGFASMAAYLSRLMHKRGTYRIGVVLEGGYDLQGLEEGMGAALGALSDPTAVAPTDTPPALSPAHEADLARVMTAQRPFWRLY